MILIILKDSSKIENFGNEAYEYGTGWLIAQDSGRQIYASKQNADVVEYAGDFPFEDFEPRKYLLVKGEIVADPSYVRPSKITEYGVPEDVIETIRANAATTAFNSLISEIAETGYKEE